MVLGRRSKALSAISCVCLTVPALAASDTGTDSTVVLEEMVVTGTRSEGTRLLESPVPIDVVNEKRLQQRAEPDLARALEFSAPAVNFPRPATTATAANTRPATLFGLAPDQVLVLINGKRRHASAVLNTNNAIGRGAAGVDLNTIPVAAIEKVEILRDGAAAQYGSDAIAGVINIILKSDHSGADTMLQAGTTEEGDGDNVAASAHGGIALGADGHLSLTAEARYQDFTNRAAVDQRFNRVTYKIGDPRSTDVNAALDAGYALGSGELYGFSTLSYRDSTNAAGFRVPGFSPIYPNGFLPLINPKILDGSVAFGYRGSLSDSMRFDVSHTVGYDDADFTVRNTANASLGTASPTEFDAGGVTYRQHTTDAVLSAALPQLLAGGNIAVGAQHRLEYYKISNGEPNAYVGTGADGFAGFNPRTPVDTHRTAYAGFVDLELHPFERWMIGGAGRYDHYSDFGGAATWKATSRVEVLPMLAFRGSVGTAFRAPSLQQQYFSAVTGNLSRGALVTVGTLPVSDPVSRTLGARDLKPEHSKNYNIGFVLTPVDEFSFTADWYRILINDRIALSEQLAGAQVTAALTAAGITNFQQVRFFVNGLNTSTEGYELAARYSTALSSSSKLSAQLSYGRFVTDIDRLPVNSVVPSLPLLGLRSILLLSEGQPRDKLIFNTALDWHAFTFSVDATRFGEYAAAPFVAEQKFSAKTVVDLTLGYAITQTLSLNAGVLNVGDEHPDLLSDPANQAAVISQTGGSFKYGEESPFGTNGRSYFLRLRAQFR